MKYKNVITIMLICLITSSSALSMYSNYGIKPKKRKMKEKRQNNNGIPLSNGVFLSKEDLLKLKMVSKKLPQDDEDWFFVSTDLFNKIDKEMKTHGKILSEIPPVFYIHSGPETPEYTFIRFLVSDEHYDSYFEFIKKHLSKLHINKDFLPSLLFDVFYYNDNCQNDASLLYHAYPLRGNRTLFFKKTVDLFPKDFFDLEFQHPLMQGATILMLESLLGCKEMVQLLVEMGANVSKKDQNGLSALDYALIGNEFYFHRAKTQIKQFCTKEKIDLVGEDVTSRQNSYNAIKNLLLLRGCTYKDRLNKEDHKRVLELTVYDPGEYLDNYPKNLL